MSLITLLPFSFSVLKRDTHICYLCLCPCSLNLKCSKWHTLFKKYWGPQPKQRGSDLHLPSHLHQLILEYTKMFPGQPRGNLSGILWTFLGPPPRNLLPAHNISLRKQPRRIILRHLSWLLLMWNSRISALNPPEMISLLILSLRKRPATL